MTCYQRHLGGLFETLGLPYDRESRIKVDIAIRELLGLGDDVHCPEIWAAIKALPAQERAELPLRVSERL